jgi:hypothetical protein
MFNLNAPVITDPWPHQIIDNFFSPDEFKVIEQTSKDLSAVFSNEIITSDNCLNIAEALDYVSDEAATIILKSNRYLLDNISTTINNFPNCRTFKNVISIPTFHILPPNVPPQKVHDEAYDKISSTVVYLYPETSTGTAMFKTSSRDSFVKEIEWKQNRAMLFCGEQEVTWHDFYSKEHNRVTLNFFIRDLKSTELIETDTYYYWKDLAGPPTVIPKTLSKEKIELLTTGILYGCL